MEYAVIKTGGKQYIVSPGDTLRIEKIKGEGLKPGSTLMFDQVLLVDDGKSLKVGTPTVSGVSVAATLIEEGRLRKITVIHFKSKVKERKKAGHRQPFMKVKIDSIKQ